MWSNSSVFTIYTWPTAEAVSLLFFIFINVSILLIFLNFRFSRYNKWTETVYPLPVGGEVKQWSGRTCQVENCHFEMCMYSVGQPERTFPLCPRCYNDPLWALIDEEMGLEEGDEKIHDLAKERQIQRVGGKTLTLECPLPDHHPSIEELSVSIIDDNDDSDGVVLIMDPHFGPKWRLVSTRTPVIVYLPRLAIEKVTVLNKKDPETNVHYMQIDFKSDKTPLPDGQTKYIVTGGNILCDEVLKGMLVVHEGSVRSKATNYKGRGGRGRGRSRGRSRGRGRGRRG